MAVAGDLGGTIREIAASESLARLRPVLPDYGITRLANITGLDTVGIPVWTVVRPFGRSLSVSQGKGVTQELAMVSGIMESIEVFHAEQRLPRRLTRGLFECERNPAFISPHRLFLRADADLSERKIPWAKGQDLFDHDMKWIPAELFDLDFSKPREPPVFLATSNGLASGNTRAEAIVHGLCEVVERDQVSFWSIEQEEPGTEPNRRVILQSIKDPICQPLLQKCLAAGLQVFVWSLAINIDIPVFACTVADRNVQTLYPQQTTGYGCHPVATVALARAITEAAQSRLTHISGLREDMTWARFREEFLCETDANRASLARLTEEPETLDFGKLRTIPARSAMHMPALLEHVLECLRSARLHNAVVVDLAENEIFSVVFVCVPDLEYRTPKARALYTPGSRMREFLKARANGKQA